MTDMAITLTDGTREYFAKAAVMGIKDGYLFVSEFKAPEPVKGISPETAEAVFSDQHTIQPHIYAVTDVAALHTDTYEDGDEGSGTDIQVEMIMEDIQQQMEAQSAS